MSGDALVEQLIADCVRGGARRVVASGHPSAIYFDTSRVEIRERLQTEPLGDYGLRLAQRLLRDVELAPMGARSPIEIAVVEAVLAS